MFLSIQIELYINHYHSGNDDPAYRQIDGKGFLGRTNDVKFNN
jgi:hypothetical protein